MEKLGKGRKDIRVRSEENDGKAWDGDERMT